MTQADAAAVDAVRPMLTADYDLIIFDMDGVLVDSERLSCHVISTTLSDMGMPMTTDQVLSRFVGKTTRDMLLELEAETSVAFVQRFVARSRPKWQALMDEALEPTPHIAPILESLRQANKAVCLASNGSLDHIQHALRVTGLAEFFAPADRFSGTLMARPKPAADLHQHCLQVYGVTAHRALVIEDSLTGLAGAMAAGIACWAYVGVHPAPDAQAQAMQAQGATRVIRSWETNPFC